MPSVGSWFLVGFHVGIFVVVIWNGTKTLATGVEGTHCNIKIISLGQATAHSDHLSESRHADNVRGSLDGRRSYPYCSASWHVVHAILRLF